MIVDRILPTHTDANSNFLYPGQKYFPETALAVIDVSGNDAAKFLQGQVTCDINTVTITQASIAAYCNAKGRVISPLLIVKTEPGFLLVLPGELRDAVLKKLRIYVLRADVKLHAADNLTVCGLQTADGLIAYPELPSAAFQVAYLPQPTIKLPAAPRFLVLSDPQSLARLHTETPANDDQTGSLAEWRFQDISTSLPWFNLSQSEQHIPQMLNIDRLGGISFNKGCYTGQEIVARSHYLGKIKRALFMAETAALPSLPADGCAVLEGDNLRNFGCVLASVTWSGITRLLLVLQIVDELPKRLILDDDYRSPVAVISDI